MRGAPNPPSSLSQFRVLLVEDSEDNQLVIQYHLQTIGVMTDLAKNGKDAIEQFTTTPYDLVLMDLQMPVMDGYSATRAIRQWESEQQRPAVPIIALTASLAPQEQQEAREAGCGDHLTKPLKKEALLNLIKKVYNHSIEADNSSNFSKKPPSPAPQDKYLAILDPDLEELVPKILEIKRQQAQEIQEAIRQNDCEAVKKLAHKMRGSHGLEGVNDLAKSIEDMANQGDLLAVQTLTHELIDYLEHVVIHFKEEMR